MFLYELAIELDERSTDVCAKAETLGLGSLLSTSELTRDQVAAIRAAYNRPLPGSQPGAAGAPPAAWGPPTAPPPGKPAGSGTGGRVGQFAAVGLVIAVVLAGFGYMVVKAGPDEKRQQAISKDLAEWNDAPPVTIDPKAAKVATDAGKDLPSDQPVDEAKMCAAQDVMYDAEIRMNHEEGGPSEADLVIWRKAVDEMAVWGSADAKDDINGYRDALLAFYDAAGRVGLGKARPQFDAVKQAEDRMYPQIIPYCGYPGD